MAAYNHYTPRSDGSYRRSGSGEAAPQRRPSYPSQPSQPQKPPPPPLPKEPPCNPPPDFCPPPPPESRDQGILSFLRGLLPRQLDAADLLVISLLLLMDRQEEDQGLSPLLTIALYFLL